MKRKIIASVLGVAAFVAVSSLSYGQGSVEFQNYSFGADALNAPVTYAGSGIAVGDEFTATLLYSLDGGTTFNPLNAATANDSTYPTTFGIPGVTSDGDTADLAGYFFGNPVTIANYTSGPISFIVQAFNGASYGEAGFYSGESAAFTMASISTGTTPAGDFGGAMQGFTVSLVSVPEPATMALLGLGAAGLLALRRRKA